MSTTVHMCTGGTTRCATGCITGHLIGHCLNKSVSSTSYLLHEVVPDLAWELNGQKAVLQMSTF